jgi:hypothetical protein
MAMKLLAVKAEFCQVTKALDEFFLEQIKQQQENAQGRGHAVGGINSK